MAANSIREDEDISTVKKSVKIDAGVLPSSGQVPTTLPIEEIWSTGPTSVASISFQNAAKVFLELSTGFSYTVPSQYAM